MSVAGRVALDLADQRLGRGHDRRSSRRGSWWRRAVVERSSRLSAALSMVRALRGAVVAVDHGRDSTALPARAGRALAGILPRVSL